MNYSTNGSTVDQYSQLQINGGIHIIFFLFLEEIIILWVLIKCASLCEVPNVYQHNTVLMRNNIIINTSLMFEKKKQQQHIIWSYDIVRRESSQTVGRKSMPILKQLNFRPYLSSINSLCDKSIQAQLFFNQLDFEEVSNLNN